MKRVNEINKTIKERKGKMQEKIKVKGKRWGLKKKGKEGSKKEKKKRKEGGKQGSKKGKTATNKLNTYVVQDMARQIQSGHPVQYLLGNHCHVFLVKRSGKME